MATVALRAQDRERLARGARRVVDVPPAYAPWGPCAVGEGHVLIVQPPGEGAAQQTWVSFVNVTIGQGEVSHEQA